jgi:long-chain acyl-CoA synthetase
MSIISNKISKAQTVNSVEFKDLVSKYSSLGDSLCKNALEFHNKPFIIDYNEFGIRKEFSYIEFSIIVGKVSQYLNNKGIGIGDRVAIFAYNHWETVVQYFAIWSVGATVVPINSTEDDQRNEYIIKDSNSKLVFVRSEFLEKVKSISNNINKELLICVSGEKDVEYDFFTDLILNDNSKIFHPISNLLNQECMIVYTSGTTGNPKGVMLAHGNLLSDSKGISECHKINNLTIMMCVLPIHHVNGTVVTIVTPMCSGSTVVLNRKFQTGLFFERLAKEKVNIVSVVPTLLAFLMQADIDINKFDLTNFQHVICGAGPLTCELAISFEEKYNLKVIHGYGLSETTCYSCFVPVDLNLFDHKKWMNNYGFPSIGVPIAQNEMDIQNEFGESLKEETKGEIVIRGHNVMLGYYNNDEANESSFKYNWLRSGDEGFFKFDSDSNKFFFITGRLKELIIRGGVNISPLEIDEVINSHIKVKAGITVAYENDIYGEEVGALVDKLDDSLTEEELIAYCREHLPFHKTPKVIIFSNNIPVTSTGKYQRNKVKYLFKDFKNIQFKDLK